MAHVGRNVYQINYREGFSPKIVHFVDFYFRGIL